MERLTVMTDKGAALMMGGPYESEWAARDDLMKRYKVAVARLAAYEDTGFTPEEISQQRFFIAALKAPEKLARLRDIVLADEAGRLVVLDKPRKPLVWGDDAHDTVLCPNCNHDLMGGFPEGESCEMPMYQCPYCGQPIDDEKALTRQEAEAALREEDEE